ncbi:CYFA0S09e02520g1_1 [Cyberlindnera fabianii]|uniref:Derlin n=1 Tax=Cyberlindnera fabianii TaxID=36022 RepID=A0A061AXK4_CYBFA|nr:CYFA0S09e02520g1_1 [Cyberlindnera fabianii]
MERAVLAWALEMPIVTRCWSIAILAASVLVSTNLISDKDLSFVPIAIVKKHQYWRLFSSFFYFGEIDLYMLYQVYIITQHSCTIEQGFNSSADYLWYIFVNCFVLIIYSFLFNTNTWLSFALVASLMYVWSRQNPHEEIAIFGFLNIKATYYAFVIIAQALLWRGSISAAGLAGLVVGHTLFYFEDVFSKLHNNIKILQPPWRWRTRPIPHINPDEGAREGLLPEGAPEDPLVEQERLPN